MSKKAEILLVSMILLGIIALSIAFVENKLEEKVYLVDTHNHIIYNLKSSSSSCNFNEIQVDATNVIFIKSLEEFKSYNRSQICP